MYRNLKTVKRKYNLYHTRFYFKLCYIDNLQKILPIFLPTVEETWKEQHVKRIR